MRRAVRVRGLAAPAIATALLVVTGCGSATSGAPSAEPLPGADPALYAALPEPIRESGVIRFAGDSHPPYRTVEPDGTVSGIDPDFQEALGTVLGVRVETRIVDGLPAALQGMLADRYDAFNGPVKATAQREEQFDTVTWMTTRTSYVLPADPAAGIAGPQDLCGKRIAVAAGSVVEEQLARLSRHCEQTGRPGAQSIGLADTNETLLAARSGRADAAGMTQAAAIEVTNERQGEFTYVTQTEQQGATVDNMALFVPESSGLGPVLRDAFRKLFADGTYAEIMQLWGLEDVTVAEPVLNAGSRGNPS